MDFSLSLEHNQSQAQEVRSQAGVTEVVFHIFRKVKSKHSSLGKKKPK